LVSMAGAALLALSGCKEEAGIDKAEAVVLDTIVKKVSYIVGYNTANQIKTEGFIMDPEVLAVAVTHSNTDQEPLLNDEEMRATMVAFQTQLQEKRQAQFETASEENLQKGQAFLAENAKREGVVTTESGLQYEVVTAGSGESPKVTDEVSVNYTGLLTTGEIFDEGDDVTFTVGHLIPGWVEALPMMTVGASWKLYVPSELAYGAGDSGNIGPNSTLIFDMELISINPQAETDTE
jgi:FKBP-type peptidyl-prolyl cis-trans isomerase